MTEAPGTAREAAERNAQAVMSGNLSQIMADITPEALTKMLQLAASRPEAQGMLTGGIPAAGQLPAITSFRVEEAGSGGDGEEVFHVTFASAQGSATMSATWKLLMGQWKIVDVALVSIDGQPSPGAA